jgi:hypothetical protein
MPAGPRDVSILRLLFPSNYPGSSKFYSWRKTIQTVGCRRRMHICRLWTRNVHHTNDVVAVMIGDSEYEDRAAVQGKKQLVKPDKKKKQSSGTLLPLGLCRRGRALSESECLIGKLDCQRGAPMLVNRFSSKTTFQNYISL